MNAPQIIQHGKRNGDDMVVYYQTSTGTDIFGLAVPNLWGGEGWDLGPTWCYLVCGSDTILIDTGRFGNFDILGSLLNSAGKRIEDVDVITVTHSHEDHDGNLPEVMTVGPQLWSHSIYPTMIAYHPQIGHGAGRPDMPGSCRFCFMPEDVYKVCIPYHLKRSQLRVDRTIEEDDVLPITNMSIVHTPGHTPDSICIIVDEEVIITGDTLLPDITPHPSSEWYFDINQQILPEGYREYNSVYGLMVYIESLNKLVSLDTDQFKAILPGHRLFHDGQFNLIHSARKRAQEIIQFHADRCGDILRIAGDRQLDLDDIAEAHFTPEQLRGNGKLMARSELTAHLEVMERSGDIYWVGDRGDQIQTTGSSKSLEVILSYL